MCVCLNTQLFYMYIPRNRQESWLPEPAAWLYDFQVAYATWHVRLEGPFQILGLISNKYHMAFQPRNWELIN
jgi:hypothetical protein